MSNTSRWIFELQEDAARMSYDNFVQRHGYAYADIWIDVNGPERAHFVEAEAFAHE